MANYYSNAEGIANTFYVESPKLFTIVEKALALMGACYEESSYYPNEASDVRNLEQPLCDGNGDDIEDEESRESAEYQKIAAALRELKQAALDSENSLAIESVGAFIAYIDEQFQHGKMIGHVYDLYPVADEHGNYQFNLELYAEDAESFINDAIDALGRLLANLDQRKDMVVDYVVSATCSRLIGGEHFASVVSHSKQGSVFINMDDRFVSRLVPNASSEHEGTCEEARLLLKSLHYEGLDPTTEGEQSDLQQRVAELMAASADENCVRTSLEGVNCLGVDEKMGQYIESVVNAMGALPDGSDFDNLDDMRLVQFKTMLETRYRENGLSLDALKAQFNFALKAIKERDLDIKLENGAKVGTKVLAMGNSNVDVHSDLLVYSQFAHYVLLLDDDNAIMGLPVSSLNSLSYAATGIATKRGFTVVDTDWAMDCANEIHQKKRAEHKLKPSGMTV